MQLTQIQRVSGNFLKLIRKSSNRETVISKIIWVEFFRVGNVFVAHGIPFGKRNGSCGAGWHILTCPGLLPFHISTHDAEIGWPWGGATQGRMAQEPNWNQKTEPPEPFLREPKTEPEWPELFVSGTGTSHATVCWNSTEMQWNQSRKCAINNVWTKKFGGAVRVRV